MGVSIMELMAMRHPRRLILAGSLGALVVMTIISVFFGWAAPNLRFLPSEFGPGFEDTNTVEPVKTMLINKLQIRRAIEAEGIPHTYIYCNCFAAYFVQLITPSTDNKVIIQGDGNGKAVFVREEDIATYTIKALDDPRTLNKAFHLRPIPNIISYNELVALWEKKTGRNFEKIYVPEHQALQLIAESPFPRNYDLGIHYTLLRN